MKINVTREALWMTLQQYNLHKDYNYETTLEVDGSKATLVFTTKTSNVKIKLGEEPVP